MVQSSPVPQFFHCPREGHHFLLKKNRRPGPKNRNTDWAIRFAWKLRKSFFHQVQVKKLVPATTHNIPRWAMWVGSDKRRILNKLSKIEAVAMGKQVNMKLNIARGQFRISLSANNLAIQVAHASKNRIIPPSKIRLRILKSPI